MSDNPLLTKPRESVVELWPGEVERQLFDMETALDEAQRKADAWDEEQRTSGAKRAVKPKNPHVAEADRLAKEIDKITETVQPVRLVLREPKAREVRQVRDDHPPRKGNEEDELAGVNLATFHAGLGGLCVVEPEVTAEQWSEFVDSCSEYDWRKITAALDSLSSTEVSVPKLSAVSVLTEHRRRISKRLAAGE